MDIEFFFPYLLQFVVLSVSLTLIYHLYNYKSKGITNLPPGRKGLPFIGETIEFGRASQEGVPERFINDRMNKYSPDVFRTSLLGENAVVLCGAAGNKFLFSGQNKYVTAWFPYSIRRALMFPSTINDESSRKESTQLRSFLPAFLRPETLQHYIPIMDSMAREHLEKHWSPYKEVKVFPLSKKYTFNLACRLFISLDDPVQMDKFAEPYALATAGLISLPINIPGTAYNRAIKAGVVIREMLLTVVRKRKMELSENQGTCSQDLLTSMLLDKDENGEPMHEFNIVNKIIGFFVASHDTTSTSITFVVSYLAEYPHIYNGVLKEQMEIAKSKAPGELLTWDDIQKMKYSWCVACEVMRLTPPANGTFKEAMTDLTFAGFTIPKGWKAYWTVHSTHKNPKYFSDPEKFDPSRFEGKGPPPFTFVPFGGGSGICPGREYARIEILIFIHNLVTKFKWEKLDPKEKITYMPSPTPMKGLPISLKHHQTPIA